MRQLGDPVAVAECLCQHHGAVYAEHETPTNPVPRNLDQEIHTTDTVIVQVQITITERCCVVVNAALMAHSAMSQGNFEIERPIGTIRTTQENTVGSNELEMYHHAAWEVLDPGVYTYYLMNRRGSDATIYGAWIKAVASDCEG